MSVRDTQFSSGPLVQVGASPAIQIDGLGKSFEDTRVLESLDLEVARGELFALLGPNGAGKTTAVRILATLLAPDRGTVRVAGFDVVSDRREVRRRISLTGQYAALDQRQSGRENLEMIARLRQIGAAQARATARELLARFDLLAAADRRVGTYSGGMRRRLDLAAGLIGRPEVVFLDEPTTGLDPRGRQAMWEIIQALARDGVTVLLTTQYLDEADALAERIAILDGGRIVAQGSARELKRRVGGQRLDITFTDKATFATALAQLGARATQSDDQKLNVSVSVDGDAAAIRRLLDELDPERRRIADFSRHETTLDDAFMSLTGHNTEMRA